MMNQLRALAAALLLVTFVPVTGAGAQPVPGLDSHVEFTPPNFFTAPGGELWVDLTPGEPWEDGAPVEPFSIFFGLDVSNDTTAAGGGWQFHAGEQSVFGTFDGPDGSGEFSPRVLLVDGGQMLRVSLHIGPAAPGDSPLFFQVNAASMETDGGERIEANPLAGQIGDNLPTRDPLLDATHEFDGTGFSEIADPITSADQIDPSSESGSDVITADSDSDPDTDTDGADTEDDVSSDEPESATPSVAATGPDNAGQGSSSAGGGSSATTFAAAIAAVIAFLGWMLLRRRKNQEAELKKIDAIGNEILQNIDALPADEPPADEPPDLPSR